MTSRIRQPIWIVPLALSALVAAVGWWGNTSLRRSVERQLQADLAATLDANVTALEIWMSNQTQIAGMLAREQAFRSLANPVLESFNAAGEEAPAVSSANADRLNEHLRSRLQNLSYGAAHLVSTNLLVAFRTGANRMRQTLPVEEEHVAKFHELFATGNPVVITPFKPRRPQPLGFSPQRGRGAWGDGARGRLNGNRGMRGDGPPAAPVGDWAAWRNRREDVSLMQVAAPIRDERGAVAGALALVINPDAEFTRILSVARSGASGETYAFDQRGVMISRSRFDDQLKEMGLIEDREGASSALNLRLVNPAPDPARRNPTNSGAARPLIHSVASAVAGEDGFDVASSPDYRGVPVVSAWRWLPQHGFGVVVQTDAEEAYQPLQMLRSLFIILFLLLILCAIGMFVFSYSHILWRRRLKQAELQIKELGQYQLQEKIGEGGMGVVYRARHALMRRDTAVKLLLPDRADPAAIQRFEREVCLTCQLTHPNTIQVFDYGRTPEGIFYYAMEFLDGLSLHDLVSRFGPQPEERVIHILAQVCDSIGEAHSLGLVHRDIKPANVFLCNRGGIADYVKVLDFGLIRDYRRVTDGARATAEADLMGTPEFMAPEALKSAAASDPKSDIYGIGAVGYYLLTGKHVFEAQSVVELYDSHMTQIPLPPGERCGRQVSSWLEVLLLRCLERTPSLRPASVYELKTVLIGNRAVRDGEPARETWRASAQRNATATAKIG